MSTEMKKTLFFFNKQEEGYLRPGALTSLIPCLHVWQAGKIQV